MVGGTEQTVKNSADFVETLLCEKISAEEEMVSFDVKALYTSLPVQRTLAITRERLELDETLAGRTPLFVCEVVQLLKICLESTCFTFQGQFYHLQDGVAKGSPVSSVVANIFMQHFEEKAIRAAGMLKPRVWKRYVDDVFSILLRSSVDRFLANINGIDRNVNVSKTVSCRFWMSRLNRRTEAN